jgi:hypothetical protein
VSVWEQDLTQAVVWEQGPASASDNLAVAFQVAMVGLGVGWQEDREGLELELEYPDQWVVVEAWDRSAMGLDDQELGDQEREASLVLQMDVVNRYRLVRLGLRL